MLIFNDDLHLFSPIFVFSFINRKYYYLKLGKFSKHITALFLVFFTISAYTQSSFGTDSIQAYIDKAELHLEKYNYSEALENAQIAYKSAKFDNNDKNVAQILRIFALVYEFTGQKKKATKNYRNALTYASSSKSYELKAILSHRLGDIYLNSENNDTIDLGFNHHRMSYENAKIINDTTKMIRPLISQAKYYMDNNDHKKAYSKYLNQIKQIGTTHLESLENIKLNNLLARYFLMVRNYEKANKYITNSESQVQEEIDNKLNSDRLVSSYYREQAYTHKIKSDILYGQKDFQLAFKFQEKYHLSLQKSINLTKEIEVQRAMIEFEVDQMKDIANEAEENMAEMDSEEIKWQISTILGVVLVLISLAFLISAYKNNLQKKNLNNVLIEKNKELITAKETAEQVSTLKSQFISTVSHELRTPLYGVIGLTSLLMQNPEEKKKDEYLESLKFSGDYLLALINDVLQLSKIETNEVKLEKVSFDLTSLIEGIVNSLHSKQKDNNNDVHIDIDKKINTTLLGDSVRLSQILINLIGNSLKFTKNGNIWVKVKCLDYQKDNYKLHFSIKDDGIGIPKSKQDTIFESFAQVKNQNQEYEGTGLGLSIVKKLIHLHKSEIFINSEEGVGSEFSFELNYEKAVKEIDEQSQKENISIGTTNFNILIVDDNRINQIVTQNILKKKGYTCDLASNGMDSIDMLKKESYDLVLMDINMPEMNGLEATKVIRTFNTNIPIIALTAVEEGEIRDQALSVGMNDVIIKPYDTQQFFQTIMRNISKMKYI